MSYTKLVKFEWDHEKDAKNLAERGFSFARAARIFESEVIDAVDDRKDYGEVRVNAIGEVEGDVLHVTYTDRGQRRRIISARFADKQERKLWQTS